MLNNESIIFQITSRSSVNPPRRKALISSPCLPSRLPNLAFLEREGKQSGPLEIIRQIKRSPSLNDPEAGEYASDDEHQHRRQRTLSSASLSLQKATPKAMKGPPQKPKEWKEPQSYEVFRAVERRDIMFLMEVRDHAFHLLLRKSGDATPLLHAMRIGPSHREVAILLVGALSRWVNHLEAEDLEKPRIRALLKALRINLKLAIDFGLQRSQSDLVASYLQTLIMSEGDVWVLKSTASVSLALRAGVEGKPVATAGSAVRNFATRELNKAEAIAALEDYIANATFDLLLMAAWSMAQESCPDSESIPSYYFARDDRVFKDFQEKIHRYRFQISRSCSKRLRWQIKVLDKVGESHNITYRRKIEILQGELDEGIGV